MFHGGVNFFFKKVCKQIKKSVQTRKEPWKEAMQKCMIAWIMDFLALKRGHAKVHDRMDYGLFGLEKRPCKSAW